MVSQRFLEIVSKVRIQVVGFRLRQLSSVKDEVLCFETPLGGEHDFPRSMHLQDAGKLYSSQHPHLL
jgi:hypothetical protein